MDMNNTCYPRLSKDGCGSDTSGLQAFHSFFCTFYGLMAFVYVYLWLRFGNHIRLGVVLFTIAGCIHNLLWVLDVHASIVEVFYNIYCMFMFFSLLLVIDFWVKLSHILYSGKSISNGIVHWFIRCVSIITSVIVFASDIAYAVRPDYLWSVTILQFIVWGLASVLITVLFIYFGRTVAKNVIASAKFGFSSNISTPRTATSSTSNPRISVSKDSENKDNEEKEESPRDNKLRVLHIKFTLIYMVFTSLGWLYGLLYILAGIYLLPGQPLYLSMWYGVYTLFHSAGAIISFSLFPLLK